MYLNLLRNVQILCYKRIQLKTNYPKSYNSPKSRLLLVIIGIVSSQLASTVIEPGQLLMLNLKMGVSLVPQGAQKSQ